MYRLMGCQITATTTRKLLRHNYKRIKALKRGKMIWLHPEWVQSVTKDFYSVGSYMSLTYS